MVTAEKLLKEGLLHLDFSYSVAQINAFMTYLSELKKWNRAYNLTALRSDEDIIIKHFLDSLLYLRVISEDVLKIADAGTGAGFPGIPIKIMRPEIELTLIDSSRKKTAFLRHILRVLKLSRVTVLNNRIESLDKEYEKYFDVIVSRATFKIKDFIKNASPYIKENGRLVLSKGPRFSEEIKEIRNYDIVVRTQRLPFLNIERQLIVLKRGEKI